MALYEITLRQRYFNQLCINVFSYFVAQEIGATPTALELLTLAGFIPSGDPLAFPDDSIAFWMTQAQGTDLEYLSVEARELYSLVDFYEAAYTPILTGEASGSDPASPFIAFGLYTARVRLDIRRGFKRFAGVLEGQMTNGGDVGAGTKVVLAGLCTAMSVDLVGTTCSYVPCVISREKVVAPITGKVTYELYPTRAEQEEHVAQPVVWSAYDQVRSQTSRQYGHGA